MGKRKKKPFINKKEGQTYSLVPRSHNDPKAGDVNEAQYVLKPKGPLTDDKRHVEQKTLGIDFEDEYDYLQHLKAPGCALASLGDTPIGRQGQANLPEEFFGQEVTVQGHLDKVLPVSGPRPDWDPEIVEALETAEVSSTTNQDQDKELDDYFSLLADSGQSGVPVYVMEQQEEASTDSQWWKARGDFEHLQPSGAHRGSSDGESAPSVLSGRDSTPGSIEKKRTARFTEYSMSSSVVPRSEALTLLDDRFEEFMAGYSDEQLGAVGEDGDGGVVEEASPDPKHSEYDRMMLQIAVEDFDKNFKEDVGGISEARADASGSEGEVSGVESVEESDEDGGSVDSSTEEGSDDDQAKEELDIIEMDETRKEDRLDCESILSTYSTLYNHPTRIMEPRTARVSSGDGVIELSKKTGMPLGVIPGPLPKENHPSRGTITRPKNETKEEKRSRKLALKEDRKQRRADKKATKLLFKAEAMKQGKTILNSSAHVASVV